MSYATELMSDWRRRVFRLLPICGLAAVGMIHWKYQPETLFVGLNEYSMIATAIGVIGFYLIRPFVLWPLSIASVFLGYLVGFPIGVPLVLAGTLLTCLPPFLLAEYFSELNGYVSRISTTGKTVLKSTGELRGIVAARLSPAPADSISIGAGLAGVPTRTFALGTVIGELPWAVLYVGVGRSLRDFSIETVWAVNGEFILLVSVCAGLLVAQPIYQLLSATRR